jgi:hypothetical protein
MPRQLVLLGDSILDNKAYVQPGERDVVAHLRAKLLPAEWSVELWAVDGAMLDRVLGTGQALVVCTIYNPRFPDEDMQQAAAAGLSFFNDVIAQEALRRDLAVIDLRQVCTDDAHFANEIEPSDLGGAAIAEAIVAAIL